VSQQPLPTHYRLAPTLVARFVGLAVVAVAVLVFVTTVIVSLTEGSLGWIVGVAVIGLVGVFVLGWWLRSKAYVVRCSSQGYSVRFVRGAGVKEARWSDVEEAVTATPHGFPCLVLKLKDGGTTSIPVTLLATDRERFVREMQRHLGQGQLGRKPRKRG